jgi:signal transduction histidine kinase
MVQEIGAAAGLGRDAKLLRSIAEQLKTPLAVIARQAELAELLGNPAAVDVKAIRTQATTALTLVESYLLGLQLLYEQTTLELEPVSVSSMLVDVAHELDGFAKQYGTGLELRIAGRYEPVMAHPRGLRSALLSLGYALLESYPAEDKKLTLAVHRTPHGIVTGVYGDYAQLSSQQWRRAIQLQGQAQQPFRALTGGSGAGIFVAQTILQAMTTKLRVGKHLNQHGLATTLQPSQQLQFV